MTIKLYYHETSGGAKYLMDNYIEWENNGEKHREGVFAGSRYIVRIDGDITEDAELVVVKNVEGGE